MRFFLILPFFMISCQHASTAKKEVVKPDRTVCKQVLDKKVTDERAVEVLPFEKKGCHVQYTKFATAKTIAKAQSEKDFCLKVKDRIVTNLTNSGFVCE